MKLLVAQLVSGHWQKVAVLSVGKHAGSYNLPARIQGTLASRAAKTAVDHFRAERAAVEINFEFSPLNTFRVTRFA